MYDIVWARGDDGVVFTYGDVYLENEREYSAFNFEVADTEFLFQEFADREVECLRTLKASLPLPAYDSVLKCCHAFNPVSYTHLHQAAVPQNLTSGRLQPQLSPLICRWCIIRPRR